MLVQRIVGTFLYYARGIDSAIQPGLPTLAGEQSKLIWNSVLSTLGAKYACFDISNMYSHTPLAPEDYKYMCSPLAALPDHTIKQYGMTSHFVLLGAPVSNIEKALKPLTVHLPNKDTIQSTHTCLLKRPDLSSLISLKVLCDAGCTVTYEGDQCKVTYKNKQIWTGVREPTTDLWVLPLTPDATRSPPTSETLRQETANNVYQMTSKELPVRFLHQCLFSSPKQTLIKVLENRQLPTWPLTKEAVVKHLTDHSPAIDKGSMKRQRQGLQVLEEEDIGIQLVEPHNHYVNAAKRAIQTFKNLFIGGISVCDTDFPTILLSRLVQQCQDAGNLLRTSRIHPKVSAYHILKGVHDFNKVPWVPPGTRASIFNQPELRASWGSRALDAWYVSPAWQHYQDNEYMRIPIALLPDHTVKQYGLREKAKNGFVYVECRRC
ncbi:hypothetical protein ACHAWF_015343, partial [Thalassiosira exigua]